MPSEGNGASVGGKTPSVGGKTPSVGGNTLFSVSQLGKTPIVGLGGETPTDKTLSVGGERWGWYERSELSAKCCDTWLWSWKNIHPSCIADLFCLAYRQGWIGHLVFGR